jgi:hypothetical protein
MLKGIAAGTTQTEEAAIVNEETTEDSNETEITE